MMNFVEGLIKAQKAINDAESLQIYPLRGTHANDVPVVMASLLATETQQLAKENERLRSERNNRQSQLEVSQTDLVNLGYEIEQLHQWAAYCRCCALNGEVPGTREEFEAKAAEPAGGGK